MFRYLKTLNEKILFLQSELGRRLWPFVFRSLKKLIFSRSCALFCSLVLSAFLNARTHSVWTTLITVQTWSGATVMVQRVPHRVCGWCAQPPACSSSSTSCPEGWRTCGCAARCWDPGDRTPSACRCSCWWSHCGPTGSHVIRSTQNS